MLLRKIWSSEFRQHMPLNSGGYTVVIVVLISLVALSMAMVLASNFIRNTKNLSQIDSSQKSLSVAESLVERLLTESNDTLTGYITNNNCGSKCSLSITENGISSSATATLSFLGNSADPYEVSLDTNEPVEVSLLGYASNSYVSVCWNGGASLTGLYVHQNGGYSADAFSYNPASGPVGDALGNGFSNATTGVTQTSCFNVITVNTPILLRLKSMYGPTPAFVYPAQFQTLPKQGIIIETTGTTGDVSKTVRVLKRTPSLPSQFDYVLFTESSLQN